MDKDKTLKESQALYGDNKINLKVSEDYIEVSDIDIDNDKDWKKFNMDKMKKLYDEDEPDDEYWENLFDMNDACVEENPNYFRNKNENKTK